MADWEPPGRFSGRGPNAPAHPRERRRQTAARRSTGLWVWIRIGGLAVAAIAAVLFLSEERLEPSGGDYTDGLVSEPVVQTVAPTAVAGEAYDWTLPPFHALDGSAGLTLRIDGRLPPGLTGAPTDGSAVRISGTPREPGEYAFDVLASTPSGKSAWREVHLAVRKPEHVARIQTPTADGEQLPRVQSPRVTGLPSSAGNSSEPSVATGAPAQPVPPSVGGHVGSGVGSSEPSALDDETRVGRPPVVPAGDERLPVIPAGDDPILSAEPMAGSETTASVEPVPQSPPRVAEPDIVTRLRERVSELPEGRFIYNRLETMWRDVPETVLLSMALGSEAAPEVPEALSGEATSGTTPITATMSAELRGTAGLKVDPSGPIEQRISHLAPTEWQWTVTPMRAEARELLTLTLYIHLGDGEPYTLRTYRDVIEVEIGWWGKAKDAISAVNPVWAFVAGAIPALWAALAWLRGRKWRRGEQEREAWKPFKTSVRTRVKGKKLRG